VPQHPQRKQGGVEREPGWGQRDRAGEQAAEAGRVAGGGQGHDGAFLITAPPAQVHGHGSVGVTEGRRVADLLPDPVPDAAGKNLAGPDGSGAGLAEAVDDEHRRVGEPGRGEGVQAMCRVVRHTLDPCVGEQAAQDAHPLPVAVVNDGEAGRTRQCPPTCCGLQQVTGGVGESSQVPVPGEVVGDGADVGCAQARLAQEPLYGRRGVLKSVLDAGQPFLLGHPGEPPAGDERGGRVVGEGAQAEHVRMTVAGLHRLASPASWRACRLASARWYQRRSALAIGPSWLAATAAAASRFPALRDR
jgi:hypothetical protein